MILILAGAVETDIFQPFPSGYSVEERNGISRVEVCSEEGFLSTEPGYPLLPLVSRIYILPGGNSVDDLRCTLEFTDDAVALSSPIEGAEEVLPFGSQPAEREPSFRRVAGDAPVVHHHTGRILNSFTIVSVSVNPWLYDPWDETLELASSCRIEFDWSPSTVQPCLSQLQSEMVEFRVNAISGESFLTDAMTAPGAKGNPDYLIITAEELVTDMSPLMAELDARSITNSVISVEEITQQWQGDDTQEQIRNCIRDHALNQGTVYVLLAGDEDVVPARQVYMECEGLVEDAPCDLYYADIDGTWDENNNDIYGEWEDSLDLYADVLLGRLLFSSSQEAAIVIGKTLQYQNSSDSDWNRQAVLCGALLFPEIGYTGVKGCEMMAEFYPDYFTLTKAYQAASGDYPDTYFPVIYSGAGWNHYAGHGNDRGIYWAGQGQPIMSVSRMAGFSNPGQYGIHSSIGCHTGDFTDPGISLSDTLLTLENGGGVACMFNTTWGWEGYWPEIGSSERLCNNTVEQVYQEKAPTLGLAYTVAKDLEIPNMTGPYDRVLQSVLAYSAFMDPSLEVLGVFSGNPVPPQPFRLVILGPNPVVNSSVSFKVTGISSEYQITVHDITGRQVVEDFELSRNTLFALDTETFYPGVYFISAKSPGGVSASGSFVRIR